ncbi:MAG: type II toxin-antitoxin system HicA family toxin [Thermodesulfobacteriota bacterium]|nr:type II toxin-antitoxin system HicA family toxin [Thermodesulfobacteriota bacterium]
MSAKQEKTLERIFERPTRADIDWSKIESLFRAHGAEIKSGKGSRVKIWLNGKSAHVHKPHPQKQAPKWLIEELRDFLDNLGIRPRH